MRSIILTAQNDTGQIIFMIVFFSITAGFIYMMHRYRQKLASVPEDFSRRNGLNFFPGAAGRIAAGEIEGRVVELKFVAASGGAGRGSQVMRVLVSHQASLDGRGFRAALKSFAGISGSTPTGDRGFDKWFSVKSVLRGKPVNDPEWREIFDDRVRELLLGINGHGLMTASHVDAGVDGGGAWIEALPITSGERLDSMLKTALLIAANAERLQP